MRININLASTPYENARRFYLRWGAALLLLIAVTVLLVLAAARSWSANHVLTRNIAEERARLAKLNDAEKADISILDEPKNRDVRQRSSAINALIVRKSFSWTRIFNDLEKMMPSRLHVVSIAPQLSKSNQLEIRMSVAGSSREKAIELVQNMEKAPDFRFPQIVSESTASKERGQTQPTDLVTFNIVAQYSPTNTPPTTTAEVTPEANTAAADTADTTDNEAAADEETPANPPANPPERKPINVKPKSAKPKGGRP